MLQPVNNHRILTVSGLPSSLCNPDTLASVQWFGRFGGIKKVCIVQNDRNYQVAYIKYANPRSATKAIQTMNLYQVLDCNNEVLRVRYNDNELYALLMNHPESAKQIHSTAASEKLDHMQLDNVYSEYKVNDTGNQFQSENHRIRFQHHALTQNYNALHREYAKMNHVLRDMKSRQEALDNRCLWLQKQLQISMNSNMELQKLLFQDESAPAHTANARHVHPEQGQKEGVVEGFAID